MKNKDLVDNVSKTECPIQMRTNAGSIVIEKQGEVLGLDAKAWVDEESVANMFSFSDMIDQFHVTFDNKEEDAFNVYVKDKIVKFKRSKDGLYYYNFPKVCIEDVKKINDKNTGVQIVNTVAENRSNYTTQQFERAKEARRLYHNI